ncbi:uncharacterized protein LOC142228709 [Haematobia irritans]|uniref:uncharacterized protein LOC142228709 n=1 Tax=Haematobia irritans TaxID=7368 RepID=UPI003F502C84
MSLLGRICRTCLLESPTMYKLADTKGEINIREMLANVIPNSDDDLEISLPEEICNDCLESLSIAYNFQQMCLANNKKLRSLIIHHEVEDVIIPDAYITEKDNLIYQIVKSNAETDELNSNEVQHAFEKLLDSSKEDLQEDETQKERKIEIHSMEEIEYDFDEFENNNDDDCWSNLVDDDNYDDIEFSKISEVKPTRKYRKNRSTKVSNNNKTCTICDKTFNKRVFLKRHMSVHSEINTFVCEICQYRFATEKLLSLHISHKHNKGEAISFAGGPYKCPDCPMVFEQTRALSAHSVIHAERDFKCKVCQMNLKTLSAVTRHMNLKHPGVLPYKCEICEKAFPVENHYQDHLNMHNGYKKHKCNMCEKSFPNSTSLRDHIRSHTGEEPFLCPQCGKSFKTSNILRQHLQRHGEKNFQCPECPMRFYAKVNLRKHMCTHSKEKPFICDVCGSSFTRNDSLKAHRFKHTGERPFKCEECNMSFVFKRHWMRHKITHTGEKPHACNYCDRSYAASGDLVKHLRTHLGENTYFCDECPLTFKYQHDLRDHKNQHYKEKTATSETMDRDTS